ncbi:hypothetical protein LINPERPRIM_LOCUS38268 [Linum perenne]
MMEIKRF